MKIHFYKRELNYMNVLLPGSHLPNPAELEALRDLNVREISVGNFGTDEVLVPFPEELFSLIDNCSSVELYGYYIRLETLFRLSLTAEKIVCGITNVDAISLLQHCLNRTLPKVHEDWKLFVHGDRTPVLQAASSHEERNTDPWYSWIDLPKITQNNGEKVRFTVFRQRNEVRIRNMTNCIF